MSCTADDRVAEIASAQHGVFARAQALAAGLTRTQIERRVRRAVWVRTLPRVYRRAAAARSPLSGLSAAVLWAGPGCALSHRSAARLWQLDGAGHGEPELVVPSRRAPRADGVVVHRVRGLDPHDVLWVARLPVTSPVRTIIDLAGLLGDHELGVAIESARARGLLSLSDLGARLDAAGWAGRAGVARARRVVAGLGTSPTAAGLEVTIARQLRARGFPAPGRGPDGARLDFAWPPAMVAIECDGRGEHERRRTRPRDRARRAELAAQGWRLLVVTWDDVARRPDELAWHLARTLALVRARDCRR